MVFGKKKTEVATTKKDATEMTEFGAGLSEDEMDALAEATGTEEIPEDQKRVPLLVWNIEDRLEDGVKVEKSKFFNCQTFEQCDEIVCALIYMKRTRERAKFDNTTKRNVVYCRSYDMETGEDLETGEIRRCAVCEHRLAKRGERKPCTEVRKIFAFDAKEKELFLFNVQRSSYIAFDRYIQRHFIRKWKRGNKRYDLPLYAKITRLKLEERDDSANLYYSLSPTCDGIDAARGNVGDDPDDQCRKTTCAEKGDH